MDEKLKKESENDSNMIGQGIIQSALNTNANITQMSSKRQHSAKGQKKVQNKSIYEKHLQKINENSKSLQSIDIINNQKSKKQIAEDNKT